nr:unnamed protein product [Digitaria exilis]
MPGQIHRSPKQKRPRPKAERHRARARSAALSSPVSHRSPTPRYTSLRPEASRRRCLPACLAPGCRWLPVAVGGGAGMPAATATAALLRLPLLKAAHRCAPCLSRPGHGCRR